MNDKEELQAIIAELEREQIDLPTTRLNIAKKQLKNRKRHRENVEKSIPLIQAISDAGIDVESVWALRGRNYDTGVVVPLLLEQLEKPYPTITRDGYVRKQARATVGKLENAISRG